MQVPYLFTHEAPADHARVLVRLQVAARNWGARVVKHRDLSIGASSRGQCSTFSDLFLSPFSDAALFYARKEVHLFRDRSPHVVIHELAHAFHDVGPTWADELDFLGWEYALALRAGGIRGWLAGMDDYGMGDLGGAMGDDYSLLDRPSRERAMFEALERCVARGTVRPDGTPLVGGKPPRF